MSSVSCVSSTDLNLFKKLSNPIVCDVEISLPSGGRGKTAEKAADKKTESMRQALSKAAAKGDDDDDDESRTGAAPSNAAPPRKASALSEAIKKAETAKTTPAPAAPASAKTKEAETDSSDEDRATKAKVQQQPSAVKADSKSSDAKDTPEDRLEKQAYLIELQGLESKGKILSRTFSMADSVAELEFEVTKQNASISTANSVAFMRDTMKLVISGVEIANAKLGPFLTIDGWATTACSDMTRYDHALEKIYKRYFRRQQMSPVLELAWLLLGSLFMHHFKAKIFGVSSAGGGARGATAGGALGGGIGGLMSMFGGGFGGAPRNVQERHRKARKEAAPPRGRPPRRPRTLRAALSLLRPPSAREQ
jgi:hypothetical protein